MVFDPFGDFETRGYLRNVRKDRDLRRVKRFEHDLFEAKIHIALSYLAACPTVTYLDFLEVHRILFLSYYPWAGQDRGTTAPSKAITKENVAFAHPLLAQRAVETGLRLGQDVSVMAQKPGEVMGLFAFGHPFLDGNGRTMLLVHIELCHRAGFSIQWQKTNKADYLTTLGQEIDTPGNGILDRYLLQFSGPCLDRETWGSEILATRGLDGLDDDNQIIGDLSEPAVAERYKELENRRGYRYDDRDSSSLF